MKTHFILSMMLLASVSFVSFGQNVNDDDFLFEEEKKHLTFKGIPIDGNAAGFSLELMYKGFDLDYYSDEGKGAVMSGQFTNYKVQLLVLTTPKTHIVRRVEVKYPARENWYDLKALYKDLKSQLTKKYGLPESYEFFSYPFEAGDGYEIVALKNEKCSFASFYYIDSFGKRIGTICLSIEKDDIGGYVSLGYEDEQNTRIMKEELNELGIINNN